MSEITFLPEQLYRNRYVTFRTHFIVDNFIQLSPDGTHRILDYGSGEGHSLHALLERFPRASFVATDFQTPIDLLKARTVRTNRIRFVSIPYEKDAPREDIGSDFDVIQLNAVFEHLLPDERRSIMPSLWARLAVGGYLIVTETPWRWFPIETHCTSWPFVNYLPDRLALAAFRACGRFPKTATFEYALREGLRGATESEIVATLAAKPGSVGYARSKTPDAADLLESWWHGECRKSRTKAVAYHTLAAVRRLTGVVISPWVNIVLQKTA